MMQLVGDYLALTARGACYLCGASKRHDGELVVDTGVGIDFEGRLAFCELCVRQMAGMVGLVDRAEMEAMRVERDAALAACAEALDRAAAADAAVEANFAYLGKRDAESSLPRWPLPEDTKAKAGA